MNIPIFAALVALVLGVFVLLTINGFKNIETTERTPQHLTDRQPAEREP